MKKSLKIIAVVSVIAICCLVLAACMPSSPEKAKENLEKNGYTAVNDTRIIPAALKLLGVDGIDSVVTGTNGEDGVTLIYFTGNKEADAAYDKVKEYAEKNSKDPVIQKSGKVIYYGTENGVKAVK